MNDFAQFGLPHLLVESLQRMGITSPTPVQKETIPLAMNQLDVLASAQTGTGKTVAYLAPLLVKLANDPKSSALILAPTRELAMQVQTTLNQIAGPKASFKTTLLIGGASMFRQLIELKKKPKVIVGTPGRITDHLLRGTLSLQTTHFLVIDEADRMLDMGFGVQLDKIIDYLPAKRQTLMFSATLPPYIEKLAKKYLQNPQRVSITTTLQPAPKIKQEILRASTQEKRTELLKQLEQREGSIIIFVRTKRRTESLAKELRQHGHSTDAMHGDLRQRRREQVIQAFRSGRNRILVATDIAGRGLDIPHVMHVINYDLPECPEDYVHRIGRTGRAEAEGFALSLVSPEDHQKWRAISRLMNGEEDTSTRETERPYFKKGPSKGKPRRPHFRFSRRGR